MSRWKTQQHSPNFIYIGKLGDAADFKDLPPSVQSAATAAAFGSVGTHQTGDVETCGSPGEVRAACRCALGRSALGLLAKACATLLDHPDSKLPSSHPPLGRQLAHSRPSLPHAAALMDLFAEYAPEGSMPSASGSFCSFP